MDLVTLGASLNGAKKQTENYVASHFKGGANIEIVDNPDGTQTIHASGEVSSTDTVAREAIVEHVQDDDNPHKVTKSQVGLGDVDNTADLAKPISTATQTALNTKANAVDVYTKAETDALIDDIDVPTSLADLTDDSTHRLVTDAEKTKLDGLANIKSVGVGLSLDDETGELTATGGGTGGTTNYNDLSNKPQINSVALSGNKTSTDLGLANASDIPTTLAELSGDSTHRVVTDSEKSAWNGKQDAIDSNHKLDADLVDDSNSTNKFNVQANWTESNSSSPSFIQNKPTIPSAGSSDPLMDGTASAGTANTYSKSDHVHPTDTSRQAVIDSNNKLSADLVDDSNSTNKFATAAELQQIETNKTNISTLSEQVGYAITTLEGVL